MPTVIKVLNTTCLCHRIWSEMRVVLGWSLMGNDWSFLYVSWGWSRPVSSPVNVIINTKYDSTFCTAEVEKYSNETFIWHYFRAVVDFHFNLRGHVLVKFHVWSHKWPFNHLLRLCRFQCSFYLSWPLYDSHYSLLVSIQFFIQCSPHRLWGNPFWLDYLRVLAFHFPNGSIWRLDLETGDAADYRPAFLFCDPLSFSVSSSYITSPLIHCAILMCGMRCDRQHGDWSSSLVSRRLSISVCTPDQRTLLIQDTSSPSLHHTHAHTRSPRHAL